MPEATDLRAIETDPFTTSGHGRDVVVVRQRDEKEGEGQAGHRSDRFEKHGGHTECLRFSRAPRASSVGHAAEHEHDRGVGECGVLHLARSIN